MTTASRLCTRDPLPSVVSRSSLAGQSGERLTQCWRLWAGTSGGRRQTYPSNECLLSAMARGRSVSFVWLRTESLVTKSYHFMFRLDQCGVYATIREQQLEPPGGFAMGVEHGHPFSHYYCVGAEVEMHPHSCSYAVYHSAYWMQLDS